MSNKITINEVRTIVRRLVRETDLVSYLMESQEEQLSDDEVWVVHDWAGREENETPQVFTTDASFEDHISSLNEEERSAIEKKKVNLKEVVAEAIIRVVQE